MGDLINQQKMFMNFWTSLKSLIILFLSCFLMDSKSISYLERQISLLMSCLSWAFLALHHFDWLSNYMVLSGTFLCRSSPAYRTHFSTAITWLRMAFLFPEPAKQTPLCHSVYPSRSLGLTVPVLWFPSHPSESCWWAFSRGSCFLYWLVRFWRQGWYGVLH